MRPTPKNNRVRFNSLFSQVCCYAGIVIRRGNYDLDIGIMETRYASIKGHACLTSGAILLNGHH